MTLIRSLQDDLSKAEEALKANEEKQQLEREGWEKEKNEAAERFSSLQAQLSEKDAQLGSLRDEKEREVQTRLLTEQELRVTLEKGETKQAAIQQLENEKESLKADVTSLREEYQRQQEEWKRSQAALNEQLYQARKTNEEKQQEIERLVSRIADQNQQADEAARVEQELRQQLVSLDQQKADLERQVEERDNLIRVRDQRIEEKETEIREKKEEIEDMKISLDVRYAQFVASSSR